MTDLQAAKAVALAYNAALVHADVADTARVIEAHTADAYGWRGVHPFNELSGAKAVAETVWMPLKTALTRLQRREDVFLAGVDTTDGKTGTWVMSMGHLMGLFDQPFLGIPPTGKIAMLRYAEFHRVEDGKIAETAFFCDILHLMLQAGLTPLPPQTGAHLVQPGPMTHDGLLRDASDPAEGQTTLDLINRMIGDIDAANAGKPLTPQEELKQCWSDDMLWWGPAGIGATYTIDRYIEQHQQPFRRHTGERIFNGHVCRMAEGNYGCFFGWPNLTLHPVGGYMGLPGNAAQPADMRVVDVYRRDGDKLAENWVFIDILHYLKMQGLDVLARMEGGLTN
jgi:ketosteroid isomerase-like protein